MIIVDTSVWIDYFAGTNSPKTEWLIHQFGEQEIGLTDLILCEVLQGLRDEASFAEMQSFLSLFTIFSSAG